MTHLKIEQNNGIIEEVSSAVIDKLYDIVHSGNLDNTSNLIGRLHASATYQDYIDYLEDTFKINGVKQLIIDANKKYISFADPVVRDYWANSSYGDGVGIDSVIANTVQNLPQQAFYNNTSLETFDELGQFTNCTAIYLQCFRGCSNLKSIDLSNITILGPGVFQNCSSLGSTNNGILNIPKLSGFQNNDGGGIFQACTSLVEINLGSQVEDSNKITSVPSFLGCSNLEKVTGLKMVTTIPTCYFYGCAKLEQLDLTSNLTTLNRGAFSGCKKLKCVDLSNVTTLDYTELFTECEELIDLTTNDPTQASSSAATYTFNQQSEIPGQVFQKCKLTNKSFNFPNTISIGRYAFLQSGIVGVSAPNATNVGDRTFANCSNLTTVNLPNLTSIDVYGFNSCTSLTTFNGNNVTSVGNLAFQGCSNLTTVTLNNTVTIGNNAFYNLTNLIQIFDPNETSANITFSGSGSQAFQDCSNLVFPQTITISSNSTNSNIDGGWLFRAFQNTTLHDVILDASVKGASQNAFANTYLTSITAPYLQSIGGFAFARTNATVIELPSVTNYCQAYNVNRAGMFSNCPNLQKVVLGHIPYIERNSDFGTGSDAWFYNTPNIKIFDVGDSITSYSCNGMGGIFRGCNGSLEKFIIRNTTVPDLDISRVITQTAANIITNFGGSSVRIYVPDSALNDYKTATNWSIIASYIYPLSDIEPTT